MSDIKHQTNCNWEKSDCEYKETHKYCPHQEHACTCKLLPSDLEKKIFKIIERVSRVWHEKGRQEEVLIWSHQKAVTEEIMHVLKDVKKETLKEVEQELLNGILYIGEEIPVTLRSDKRYKFIVLGSPQQFLEKLK